MTQGRPAAPPSGGSRARARRSVRTPLVALVLAVNLVVFAVVFLVAAGAIADQERTAERQLDQLAASQVSEVVDTAGRLRAAVLLRWAGWDRFEDAVVAQVPTRYPDGRYAVEGIHLNPLGRARRGVLFDEQAVLRDLHTTATTGEQVVTSRGVALPVELPTGERWGGLWYRPVERNVFGDVVLRFLPWIALSTLLTTLATVVTVRRLVLDPVDALARAARGVEGGDLGARAPEGRREDEIGLLARDFNAMADRIERFSLDLEREVVDATAQARRAEEAALTQRRLAATGELAAGVAHEINNPLGGLINAVDALRSGDVSDERRAEYLDLVAGGLERIHGTVGRLLRLAPREARVGEVAVAGPIADALGLVRHRAARQGARLLVGTDRDALAPADDADALAPLAALPPVRGAANELGQAVLNLLVNALDALEPRGGGTVRVSVAREGDAVRIVVEDDGPGADPDVVARASDAFFTTKDEGRGTGLGLAIVHNVAAAHGGRLELSSVPGDGFRADLVLPVADPDAA